MEQIPKNSDSKKRFYLNKQKSNKKRVVKMATELLSRTPKRVELSSTATVQKWGNSLAVRIPKEMADHKMFSNGTEVELIEMSDGLKIVLKKPKVKYSLSDLLSKCTPENRHDEIDFGFAGKEWAE